MRGLRGLKMAQQHSSSSQSRNSNHSACRVFHTDVASFPANTLLCECIYLYMNQSTPHRDTRKAITTERKVIKLSFRAHGFLMKTVMHRARTGTLRKLVLPPEDGVESPSLLTAV